MPRSDWYAARVSRADRRRADRSSPKSDLRAQPGRERTRPARVAADAARQRVVLERVAFGLLAIVFFVPLARAIEARITWYLAVDQFGYLQFANDLLHGRIFHEWEPARILKSFLPARTDVLAQTYIYDAGRLYCRYSPGFPMLVAGWIGLFGAERVSFLNPTIFLAFLGMAIACEWRLSGSAWRGLVVACLIALCPSLVYWWSLTLTRDLSAHLFAFIALYQLIPRRGQPVTTRRALVAGLALGFAGSIRNDAVLYFLPASLLAIMCWRHDRPSGRTTVRLVGIAAAAAVVGLLPTLVYNAMTSGNPFWPSQGMEIQSFLPNSTPGPGRDAAGVGYPSVWKGGSLWNVQGGGLKLKNFPTTAPREWGNIFMAYGWVLIGLAALGVVLAADRRPALFLFAVPYAVTAFLFYSCWAREDRRYIIGVYSMVPFLVTAGVVDAVGVIRRLAGWLGESKARLWAILLVVVAVVVALAPIPPPPRTVDDAFLSKGVLPILSVALPLAVALGAAAAAAWPSRRVTAALAPALAVFMVGFAFVRADATRSIRAPFQGTQAALARSTLRRALEPRSVVITAEDMGRPAENIEYYGGFPALYLTDLDRWRASVHNVAFTFITAGVRPYLLIDRGVPEAPEILSRLSENGFLAERIAEIPASRNMEYFVAAPVRRLLPSELYRISHPVWEKGLREAREKKPAS